MNPKLLGSFYFIPLVLLSNVPSAIAEDHKHLCPDMSQHERVLNQGIQMHKEHGAGKAFWSDPPMFPMQKTANDYSPSRQEADLRASLRWLESSINSLPLTTRKQRQTAEGHAEQFEQLGMYAPAKKLYERLLAAQQTDPKTDNYERSNAAKNLERAKLCQSARELVIVRHYSAAMDNLDKAVESIRSFDTDLLSKANLLKSVIADLNQAIKAQASSPGLSAEDVFRSQRTKARAEELSTTWKRELECLGMAQQLDRTAFSLEKDGQYAMAEKLYKQALLIKQKNLGVDHPETLAQNADFARLRAESGHKAEACKYYEDALKELRKLPNPGRTYTTMLESYGDMLDQMHDKQRAEKIYAEARNYHEKLSAAKN